VTAEPPDLPRVIGHRGAAGLAPANTLAGLHAAAGAGCRWVELDVRLSADRVPVLHHDRAVGANTGHPVATRTAAELARADGSVATLDAALAEAGRLRLGVNLEIKADDDDVDALVARTAAVVAGAPNVVELISGFCDAALAAARRHVPAVPRALLMQRPRVSWQDSVSAVAAGTLTMADGFVTPAFVAAARRAGFAVSVYTVNDPERARALWEWGVSAVFTDRPDRVCP